MELTPSCEADSCSATQENYHDIIEPEGSLPHSQEPSIIPYFQSDNLVTPPHSTSLISILILSTHVYLASGLFPSGLPPHPICIPLISIRATCFAHFILLDLILIIFCALVQAKLKKKTKLRGFSLQANYTVRATAAYRRS
jgi:hypothetical protein